MKTTLNPYNIHVGNWVYGHRKMNNKTRRQAEVCSPVCINAINNASVETTDGEMYVFDEISPIPLNQETLKLFDWSKAKKLSLRRNWQTGELFFRYVINTRRSREKHGLTTIHEAQQWYFQTFREPLPLKLSYSPDSPEDIHG